MASRKYKIIKKGLHDRFDLSRKKIQFFGGGYGNGKTAACVVLKILKLARDYPGSNGLVARSTYPKLNDTIRKEFIKWCPKKWIKSFPKSQNSTNTCVLVNGTEINFRYIEQQGKTTESSTSNLLSATFDWIIVDQIEDPEIEFKDFLDLLGRLRGTTPYTGTDPTMPKTGARWLCITSNPTRNWVYSKIVKPIQIYTETGRITLDLLCKRYTRVDLEDGTCTKDQVGNPILNKDGKPELIIDLFEGSTYENKENLSSDFIETLENTYTGTMKDRFIMGKWGAYEGLVYPDYDETIHAIPYDQMIKHITDDINSKYKLTLLEAYDHGLKAPACYLLALVDYIGIVYILTGFYQSELTPQNIINTIHKQRMQTVGYSSINDKVYADPSIFSRSPNGKLIVGKKTSSILYDSGKGINMRMANNAIVNGITKVQNYLQVRQELVNPFTGKQGSPMLFHSEDLPFITDEFGGYYWKKNLQQEFIEKPRDGKDHAMDAIKYLLTHRAIPAELIRNFKAISSVVNSWHETEIQQVQRNIRHG